MTCSILWAALLLPALTFGQQIRFPPTPDEDPVKGLNENCFLSAYGHPTEQDQQLFIQTLRPYVDSIAKANALPPSAIMAMTILESGFGFTRTGYYANNLFGIKVFTTDTVQAFVLKGQPDENNGKNIRIIRRTDKGQFIYDETIRTDNRYIKFSTRQNCVRYLTNTLLQKPRYKPAQVKYQNNLKKGMDEQEAALIYAYDIAQAGYNHKGGAYYRSAIEKVIKKYKI